MKLKYSLIALGVLAALVVVALVVFREPPAQKLDASFPEIAKGDVTKVWIRGPVTPENGARIDDAEPPVFEELTLEREGEGDEATWKVTSPVTYPAYKAYVDTMLTRIEEMEILDVAVESKANWEPLEVDEAKAIHIKIFGGTNQLADFYVGAYKSGNTMVRLEGDERVFKVAGSIRYVFGKRLRDWREKTILDQKAENVTRIAYESTDGRLTFEKKDGEWTQVLAEGETPLANFDPKKVASLVGTPARLRAADFDDDAVLAEAGLAPHVAKVEITVTTPGEPEVKGPEDVKAENDAGLDPMDAPEPTVETFTILVGKDTGDQQTFVMLEGNPQVFVVTRNVTERLVPAADKLTTLPKPDAPDPAAPMAGPGVAIQPPGAITDGSGGIPPEVMKQVQAEIQKQKMMKKLTEKLSKQE